MRLVDAAQLILDYTYICEKRGEVLDFEEFIDLWKFANEITEDVFDLSSRIIDE
jgi:hypothetical protein